MSIEPNGHGGPRPVVALGYPYLDLIPAAPADWIVKMSWTLLAPDGQANVIASTEPVSSHLSTETYAATQGNLLRDQFPQYREFLVTPVLIDGRPAWRREFAWVPPDGVEVTQQQLYCVVPTVGGQRGVTATATTPSTSIDRFREVFAAILGSLRIMHETS